MLQIKGEEFRDVHANGSVTVNHFKNYTQKDPPHKLDSVIFQECWDIIGGDLLKVSMNFIKCEG